MASRRRAVDAVDRPTACAWATPAALLKIAERRGGAVVFEAPEAVRIARGGPPRLPAVATAGAVGQLVSSQVEPQREGGAKGIREFHGRIVCWSCTQVLAEADMLRSAPGCLSCPGCGARLPFVE